MTAQSWAIYDAKRCSHLWSKNADSQYEIASLTKIMTAYLVCTLVNDLGLNPRNVYLRVSKKATTIGGTSAFLKEN